MADNRVCITGRLVDAVQLRYSPAGVPIARLLIEHESRQVEAGVERPIRFRVGVRAAGAVLAPEAGDWPPGTAVTVEGFLARARQRDGDSRLIISAERISIAAGDANHRE
ncbi:Primosomal replication protein N [wastewater metagenome]|uniref:Primosomal replication protein N n=2 Tax=unclassified sequences TaxID=12908 RepID=A0A5B8RFE5_9ZZZZ|nr:MULTISPECIES: primosomal replication protein N [Arhodomonas]MCS4505150.1 primosomal replication protein N [Arhodomonas aquaeolei]QEA05417.1 primosomal replication protein N [uncultured organism]